MAKMKKRYAIPLVCLLIVASFFYGRTWQWSHQTHLLCPDGFVVSVVPGACPICGEPMSFLGVANPSGITVAQLYVCCHHKQ